MKRMLLNVALFLFPFLSFAEASLSGGLDVSLKNDGGVFSSRELMSLAAESPLIDFKGSLSVNSDRKYGADIANFRDDRNFFDNYMLMETGYTTLHLKPVDFQVGRIKHQDGFASPYSLFINANNPSAVGAVLSYSDPFFTYESRWIRLNDRSNLGKNTPPAWEDDGGFPDRGANIKTITFRLGNQRFAIQDAGVYTKRSFDLEYFISPVPEYFTQYFYGTAGRPWTTSSNENNIIGFFWTLDEPDFHLGAQVLIDDFNLYFLAPKDVPNNPWKVAWTVGGEVASRWGRFGLHQAGALKYTFQPINVKKMDSAGAAYGYTLFPDTRYGVDGELRSFAIEDNALGYQHGENNLAILLTYRNSWMKSIALNAQLEFLVAGTASPANPWQDTLLPDEVGTHWIDESVLQRSVIGSADLRWKFEDWEFYAVTKLGMVWNALTLSKPRGVPSTGSSIDQWSYIYRPSDLDKTVGSLALGVTYAWDISATLDWLRNNKP